MLVAFDDTDSRKGMCTTYLVPLIWERLANYTFTNLPKLVRLNPNIPWKTRGNGAICLEVGSRQGSGIPFGRWNGKVMHYYPQGTTVDDVEGLFSIVRETVMGHSHSKEDGTNPAVAIFNQKPYPEWYHDTVKGVMDLDEAKTYAHRASVRYDFQKNGRGLIGAIAAASWPEEVFTFEVIAYRERERWGKKRDVPMKEIMQLDGKFDSTFNNFDQHSRHAPVIPNTPCPVLWGVRGRDPRQLTEVPGFLKGEAPQGWVLFKTNQGTGDHIIKGVISDMKPYHTYSIEGVVKGMPEEHTGGLVSVPFEDKTGEIRLLFYEPTKKFRQYARMLRPKDHIIAEGTYREDPEGINMESFTVLNLAQYLLSAVNPLCENCNKRMESMGKKQGLRCPQCKSRQNCEKIPNYEKRTLKLARYEVPVGARRHLHRPNWQDK